jgi:hypothetical protein
MKKKKVTKRELLQVAGKLRFCANVLFPGQAFVRIIERTANSMRELHESIRWNGKLKKEMHWWLDNLKLAQIGLPFDVLLRSPLECDVTVLTDASSTLGVGGFVYAEHGHWFQHEWIGPQIAMADIMFKELLGIVISALMWSHEWRFKVVHFRCDNQASVEVLKKMCCTFKRPDIMNLVRVLGSLCVKNKFQFWISHIPGKLNTCADALSRIFGDESQAVARSCCELELEESGAEVSKQVAYGFQLFKMNEPSADILRLCDENWRVIYKNLF